MFIKMALEEMEESSKQKPHKCGLLTDSHRSMDLAQSVMLCKFCLNCKLTSLQDSILKLHKGVVSNVQKHMKTCHSKDYQQSLHNPNDSHPNKKQKTLESSCSTKK